MDAIFLKNTDIDLASEKLYNYLLAHKVQERVALQNRLMLEELLLKYQEQFSVYCELTISEEKHLTGNSMVLRIKGESFDPFDEESGSGLLNRLMANVGLAPIWTYKKGCNCIIFTVKRTRKMSDLAWILVGVLLGFLIGFAAENTLSADFVASLCENVLTPISDTIMGFLGAVATMLIFLSVTGGVCNMGDMSTFNRIGKKMLGRFMLWMVIFVGAGFAVLLPFFTVTGADGAGLGGSSLLAMLLDIVPGSLLEPFVTGNTLQVIFLAICCGIALLILNIKANTLITVVNEGTELIQLLLDGVLKLLPVVVFIAIFQIIATGQLSTIASVYKYPLLVLGADLVFMLINTARVCLSQHIGVSALIKKVMPAYSIGLATASSPAAYSTNVSSCIQSLGIDRQLVDVGIPLGQVIYMPASVLEVCAVALCMGEMYGVDITVSWLVALAIIAFIMGIATPPLPGATISCHMLVMAQLGIPAEAIAIVIALDALVSRISTSTNIYLLQTELTQIGASLDLLHKDILKK